MIIIFGTLVWNDDIFRFCFNFYETFIVWAVRGVKGQKIAQMENNNYICYMPYLRNSVAYDHDFRYFCKMIISPGVSSFVFNFHFLGCYGVKGQKMVQNDKTFCRPCSISQESYIIWLSFMIHIYRMTRSPGFFSLWLSFMVRICRMPRSPGFFSFFQNFDFLGCYGWAKIGPKWQKSLSRSISQKPYIIWFSFMVHMCKMIISPAAFFMFSKIISAGGFFQFYKILFFRVVRWGDGKETKKRSKMTKNSVCFTPFLRNHTSYDFIYCTHL